MLCFLYFWLILDAISIPVIAFFIYKHGLAWFIEEKKEADVHKQV